MFDLIVRENIILNILGKLESKGLDFIVVGGYGVSSYKHRFSVDADIIIKGKDVEKFEDILKANKFVKTQSKDLDHVYAPKFIRYTLKDKLAVNVDLLVDGIGSRTTEASFSFDEIDRLSNKRKIKGREKIITAKVPQKEVLIALKLHSGRLTDLRDITALSKDMDIELIKKMINRGDTKLVKSNIRKLLDLIEEKRFINSFKGVFQEKEYDVDLESIKRLKEVL